MRTVKIEDWYGNKDIEIMRLKNECCWLSVMRRDNKLNAKQCRRIAAALIKAADEMEKEK